MLESLLQGGVRRWKSYEARRRMKQVFGRIELLVLFLLYGRLSLPRRFQNSSISSKLLFLVSGTKNRVKTACRKSHSREETEGQSLADLRARPHPAARVSSPAVRASLPVNSEPRTQPHKRELKAQPRLRSFSPKCIRRLGPGAGDNGDVEAEEETSERGGACSGRQKNEP